jgi:hypothetical protein
VDGESGNELLRIADGGNLIVTNGGLYANAVYSGGVRMPAAFILNSTTNAPDANGVVDLGTIAGAADNLGNGDGGGTVTIGNIVGIADAGGTNSANPNLRQLYDSS